MRGAFGGCTPGCRGQGLEWRGMGGGRCTTICGPFLSWRPTYIIGVADRPFNPVSRLLWHHNPRVGSSSLSSATKFINKFNDIELTLLSAVVQNALTHSLHTLVQFRLEKRYANS